MNEQGKFRIRVYFYVYYQDLRSRYVLILSFLIKAALLTSCQNINLFLCLVSILPQSNRVL